MVSPFTDKTLDTSAKLAGRPPANGRIRRGWPWLLSLALIALVAGYGAFRLLQRDQANADALWAEAERDFMAGRYDRVDQAVVRLQRLREPTPLDWFLHAQLAMARNNNDQCLRISSVCPMSTTWPPRRGCWQVKPS